MIYSKDEPSDKPTYRQEFQSPEGPPPGYEQRSPNTNPFARAPSPAAYGYPPSPGYSSSPQPNYQTQQPPNYMYGQNPPMYQASSSQHLSPQPTPTQPSPAPSSSKSSSFLSGISGTSLESLLNPPPPSFARAPQQAAYAPFPPCVAVSLGTGLDGGFPPLPPPATVQPHPFASHDVQEEDWTRFLGDLKKIGTLSPMNKIVANVAPMAMGVGLMGGFFLSKVFENRMKSKKSGPASQLVEYWNNYFFRPRMMEITLVHGHTVYNSSSELPPQMVQQGYRRREDRDYDSSSSSSSDSSDSEDGHKHNHPSSHAGPSNGGMLMDRRAMRGQRREMRQARRDERREQKRERRDERREDKRARKEERRERKRERKGKRTQEKADRKEPWKIVVSYKPLTTM